MLKGPLLELGRHRLVLVIAAAAAYAASYVALYAVVGAGFSAFVVIPVMVAAWAYAVPGGVVATFVALYLLNPALRLAVGREPAYAGWLMLLLLLIIAVAVGRVATLQRRLRALLAQKQLDANVRRSEEHFRALIENSLDMILVLDAGGTIRYGSPSARQLLGFDPAANVGRPICDFIHPDDVAAAADGIAELTRGRAPEPMELRARHADGGWSVVEVRGRSLLDQAAVGGIVLNVRDLSERRALEDQLRQSQKMEAVGRLAGGVAHDFNNLLTAIKGNAEMLLMDDLDREVADGLEEITRAADRAATLTKQLLAFSRKQVLQPRVMSLNCSVAEIAPMLRRLIGADIELRTVLDTRLGSVRADPGQVEQVLLNLAVNARDAMPRGGKLTMETANVEFDDAYARSHVGVEPGRYAMLAVSDTGHGIDAATRAHIFEPFFTTKEQGTGLGLSTVYGIVKQSGGHVWVYSEVGVGTCFKIYLPRAEVGVEAVEAVPLPMRVTGSERVLVVEDEPIVRELIQRVLERCGFRALTAGDADEALRLLDEAPDVDLLITDVVLPGIDGRQLADRIRTLRPQMPVIFTSGYADDAIVHHGVLDPGMHFLQKPFPPDALTRMAREVLDQPLAV